MMKFFFQQPIFLLVFLGLCTLLCRGGGKQKVSWEEMEEKIQSIDEENQDVLATTIPPLVFILGVQKGGSSSLMWHIITHPQLCSGVRKETHFFGGNYEKLVDADTEFEIIVEKYLSLFTDKKCTESGRAYMAQDEKQKFVDGTPVLHQAFWASKNINDMYSRIGYNDKVKFIVMLREPVSRDFSWYQHHVRQYLAGRKSKSEYKNKGSIADLKTFKEEWHDDIKAVKQGSKEREDVPNDIGGDYLIQLKEFMKYFQRDQIFIINSNHAFKQTADAMERIRQFLELDSYAPWESEPFPHDDHLGSTLNSDNPKCVLSHVPLMDCDFRDMLAEHYADGNEALVDWMAQSQEKGLAPSSEPPFEAFDDSYRNIPCVADARKELNKIIKNDEGDTC